MGCMEMSHSALAIYYKAVQATPQIPLQLGYNEAKLGILSRNIRGSQRQKKMILLKLLYNHSISADNWRFS